MSKSSQPKSFEQALSELDGLIQQMESGQISLEQAIAAYQRGSELLQYCRKALSDAEQKVQVLNENNSLQTHIEPDRP